MNSPPPGPGGAITDPIARTSLKDIVPGMPAPGALIPGGFPAARGTHSAEPALTGLRPNRAGGRTQRLHNGGGPSSLLSPADR